MPSCRVGLSFVIVRAMQQMTSTQLYFRLLRYVKPYWGVFLPCR